ncbi:Flagellar motor switch protein FliG [Rubripirellula lacrimiformis]|uniref:Flagellar motor switch protein FliG n=1 Tax=Rubripirellula lacrimiformis TaxID=1930273 RepID=A0A517NIL3_9BACT|nr:flagellar motor switch protein FliG [Rubripirellula lacrimiformis]QDT06928.1 Flagellar motor switch protein FliG [Rubripirellula lacrimiformis]
MTLQNSPGLDEEGLRKASILLMSMPSSLAATVLSKLSPRYIEAIGLTIAKTESVGGEDQELVLAEFLNSKVSLLSAGLGGLERAGELLVEAFGHDAQDLVDALQQAIESPQFGFLRNVDAQTVLQNVRNEHPQAIAFLLCHVSGPCAAEVITGLDPDQRLDVVSRLAAMEKASPGAVKELNDGLELQISGLGGQHIQVGGVEVVANILKASEPSNESRLLEAVGQEDPELRDEIRRLMFVFDDISKLVDCDIQTLLKQVATSDWAMSLKGADTQLKEKIMLNMSSGAAANLQEEIEYLGSVRLKEVELARQKIINIARQLDDAGQISRRTCEGEEELFT